MSELGADTLEQLVTIWRSTKSAEVAAAARRLTDTLESETAKALRATAKIPQEQWMGFAASSNLVDRGAAYATLASGRSADVKARVIHTDNWGADPRLADALHEIVKEVPWVSTSSRVVWTQIFKRMVALGDPRSIEIAGRFDPSSLGSGWDGPGEYLQSRLEKVAEKIIPMQASIAAMTDEETALLADVVKRLPSEDTQSTDELIAAALADPLQDELRIVVSDALQDRGDVRGELIMLQARVEQGTADKATVKRVKAILKSHRSELLGPLADVLFVKGLEFRLGFVDTAEVKSVVHHNKIEAALSSPLAASIHRLEGPGSFLIRPELRGLRHARIYGEAEAVFACDRPLPFVSLQMFVRKDELASLQRTAALPKLTELSTYSTDHLVPEILHSAIAMKVPTLKLLGVNAAMFRNHVEVLGSIGKSNVTTFVVETHEERSYSSFYRVEFALTRESPGSEWSGAGISVELPTKNHLGDSPHWAHWLGQCLAGLPKSVRRIEVTSTKPLKGENRALLSATLETHWATPVDLP